MPRTFEIVFMASEMVPYCKTGGLADVIGALPEELARQGNNVTVIIPYYREVAEWAEKNKSVPPIVVDALPFFLPGYTQTACVRKIDDPSGMNILFIDYPSAFDREELYTEGGQDYEDNLTRYAIFCKAGIEACKALAIRPDILHANDWQAAMAPVYLKTHYGQDPFFENTSSILTIHNLGYQGRFSGDKFQGLDLPWELFNPEGLEYFGQVNILKGGIIFADSVTTVSPTYAKEIQTPEFGAGMDGLLASRSDKLVGILNGVDYSDWNPNTDKLIPVKYSKDNLDGKWQCRTQLRKEVGLPDCKAPLIGMISRLAEQKGFEILLKALPRLMKLNLQIVILGTGDPRYHTELGKAAEKYPDKLAIKLTFSNELAHQIEAGCDMFLMPSRYEPCGLNQMYSLRYGTVPIVSSTGGLKDTVENVTPARLKKGSATGFVMKAFSEGSLYSTVKKAVQLFSEDKKNWRKLIEASMSKDFGWTTQARQYTKLYSELSKEAAAVS